MKFISVIITLLFCAITAQSTSKIVSVALQPVNTNTPNKPTVLATIKYDVFTFDTEFSSYEAPDLSEIIHNDQSAPKTKYLRIGIYDPITTSWKSSTTITSVETFAKGYSPTFIINFNKERTIIGVSVKGQRIDAGATRDFGPKIEVIQMSNGPKPYLNRPIVLKEGKVEAPVPEKSFLQKYWWIILAAMMLLMSTKGDTD